ncbi:MAG: amylo-alpha-1,6-glucosidase [Planctomycetes bacterium]|nr:amylo-alpha-1,6-glucosidase [Planctomycetota bacterium]
MAGPARRRDAPLAGPGGPRDPAAGGRGDRPDRQRAGRQGAHRDADRPLRRPPGAGRGSGGDPAGRSRGGGAVGAGAGLPAGGHRQHDGRRVRRRRQERLPLRRHRTARRTPPGGVHPRRFPDELHLGHLHRLADRLRARPRPAGGPLSPRRGHARAVRLELVRKCACGRREGGIVGANRTLVRIRPRPNTGFVSQGRTVLATGSDGFVDGGADHGLFVHQTRMISRYRWRFNGGAPEPVVLSNVLQHTWMGYYILVPPGAEAGAPDEGSGQMRPVSEQTLELRLSRSVGGGVHEDVDLTNFSTEPTAFTLELDVDADFADQIETRGPRRQTGELSRQWGEGPGGAELLFDYRAEHTCDRQGDRGTARLHRGLALRIRRADSPPRWENGRIRFDVRLPPGGRWHACLLLVPLLEGEAIEPPAACREFVRAGPPPGERPAATAFSTPDSTTLAPVVINALNQACEDLAAMRLDDAGSDGRGWTVAAGLPMYVALYGRDTLTAAWQSGLAQTAMMDGTLAALASRQGTRRDDWRDEQPGRMLHEAHTGPLQMLNFNPRRRYYGSITTSAFYAVVVAELWHWTGDRERVQPFIEPALKALRWLDDCSDLNGDGFYDYQTRSQQGVIHQAWKDSPGAIVHADGSPAPTPIATCEEQGFAYVAKLHLSEVLWWFGRRDEARLLYHEAGELRKRFNDAFWQAEDGTFVMGIDGQGRPIRSAGSNPGHCIATGIADKALVPPAVERLFRDDLFSGWGIRTLSADHPSYNPYSYHRGSVWPVEHGTFAIGFYRWGLHEDVERLCRAQFEAAAMFDLQRLPEVFSGHARDGDHPFPALYPQANSPQAWSASAVYCMLQAMLGLYPYAPLHLLLVDPHLPPWLPDITLTDIAVGRATATVRFQRKANGASTYEVLRKRGPLHVVRQPSPWSLTAGFAERARDALASLLPGK